MIFIGFVLAIPVVMSWIDSESKLYNILADMVSGPTLLILMILIMVFTVYTGVDYWVKYKKAMKEIE
jgi:phosphatidylglycerophosphate synthase